jgi:TetR/AcrR family transcriptional regulator, cholesterol catabolism regulator
MNLERGGVVSRSPEIQAAAVRLFYEQGYNATSLKDIAKVVGMRPPSLYNYIDSKQKLLQDIMFDGISLLTADFDTAIARSEDVVEQIRLAAEALTWHNIHRQTQAYVNTVEIPSLEEPARAELIRRRRAYVRRWAALIERGVAEGLAVAPEPMLIAFNIVDLIAGLARWYQPSGRWSEASLIEHYGQLTLRMLQCNR